MSVSEPAIIGVVRERLEAELPGHASGVLSRALARWGGRVPQRFAERVDVIHGPLREELAATEGDARAHALVELLEERPRVSEMPTGTLGAVPRGGFDDAPTRAVPRRPGPVGVRGGAEVRTLASEHGVGPILDVLRARAP